MSNSQLYELISQIKNGTDVTLNLSSNVIRDYHDETNFPRKLLLIDTQVLRLHKTFANNSSANMKLLKTQLSKLVQPGGFSGRLLGPVLRTDLPLMKNVLKPLTKSVLIRINSISNRHRNT